MAEFSYESDIAPMRGDNFYVGPVPTGREYQRFLTTKSMIEKDLQSGRAQLEFERTKIALEAAKREAQQQIEFTNLYPKISERITGILSDQTKDPVTRVTELEKARTEFGTAVINNPAINNIFNAASSAVTVKDQQEAQRNALAANLTQLGQAEGVKALFGGDISSGSGQQFYNAALAVGEEKKKEEELSKNVQLQKLTVEQQKELRKVDLDTLKGHESSLRSMTPKELSEDDFISAVKSGTAPEKVGTTPQFNPLQVIELKEMMMDLNPSLQKNPEQLDSVPPEELYRNAFRMLSRRRRAYFPSATTSTKSLFEE